MADHDLALIMLVPVTLDEVFPAAGSVLWEYLCTEVVAAHRTWSQTTDTKEECPRNMQDLCLTCIKFVSTATMWE